jgi:hypothetical protein
MKSTHLRTIVRTYIFIVEKMAPTILFPCIREGVLVAKNVVLKVNVDLI